MNPFDSAIYVLSMVWILNKVNQADYTTSWIIVVACLFGIMFIWIFSPDIMAGDDE